MHWRWWIILGITAVLLGWVIYVAYRDHDADDPPVEPMDGTTLHFARDVQPILQKECYACHNAGKRKGKIDLQSSFADLRRILTPGQPETSKLYLSLLGEKVKLMPPDHRLKRREIEIIRAWIEAGAKQD